MFYVLSCWYWYVRFRYLASSDVPNAVAVLGPGNNLTANDSSWIVRRENLSWFRHRCRITVTYSKWASMIKDRNWRSLLATRIHIHSGLCWVWWMSVRNLRRWCQERNGIINKKPPFHPPTHQHTSWTRFNLRMNEASLRNVDETDLTCYPSSSKSSLKQCPNAVRRPIPDYPPHKNSPFGDKRDTRSSHHNTPDYLLL